MRLHPRAVRLLPLLLPVLLLPVRGEAHGQSLADPGCTPSPVPMTSFANPNAAITEIAAVGSTLFFSANDGAGFRLWKLEQGEAVPEILNPLSGSWPANVESVSKLIAVGQRLFFVVKVELDTELWATDGLHTGIERIGTFPGSTLVDGQEFAVLGSTLFFRADNTGDGPVLWMTYEDAQNRTGVQPVSDINGMPIEDPAGMTVLNGKLFFAAVYRTNERELWTSDAAQGSARLFKDIWPGASSGSPASLRVMGGKLYFTATGSSGDAQLWVSTGEFVGAEGDAQPAVTNAVLGDTHGSLEELTVVGDKLFFRMSQTETGEELWVSDGTEAGTRIVKEIQEGGSGGFPAKLTAVGRMLFFMANDGMTGQEPWRSDGTEAGTSLVGEFYEGTGGSLTEPVLQAGPGVLLLSIFADGTGTELWSISEAEALRLTDIVPGEENSDPHGMTIVGDRLYFAARARLSDQGQELFFLPLTEVDCTTPTVECPAPLEVEAVSSLGALVFIPPPKAMSDDSFTPLTVTYSHTSPAILPIAPSTLVTITVSDMAGRAGTCSLPVTVEDTTRPTLECPARLVVEATSASGASVRFPLVAWDAVSEVSVSATPASETYFNLNEETRVEVTAMDGSGNLTGCGFPVTVKDTVAPKLICPPDIVRVATREEPAPITLTYPRPEPEDVTEVTLVEDLEHPSSGSAFNVGRTEVKLSAVDTSGNTSRCSFLVHIVDPVAPTITCPGPQQAVATGEEGAVVDFPEAEAEDEGSQPTLRYSAEPGSTFPVGETTVTATASDGGGNEASCSFTVTVTEEDSLLQGCGCRAGSASASVYWLLLALAPLWARRRAGRLAR